MVSVDTLVCSCGMRMKAPGAVPGRVGKCPRCGSLLTVPEVAISPVIEPEIEPVTVEKPTFVGRRGRDPKPVVSRSSFSNGLVGCPTIAETRWRDSLLYPLRNDSGLAILAFMPIGLWLTTVPMFALVPSFLKGSALTLLAIVFLVPEVLLLFATAGYTLLFFGQVLVSSSLGEVTIPRLPGWSLSEIGLGWGRWFWALVVGGVVGGFPTLVYWINCGDVDWLDRVILVDLIIPGLAYAQMALLAALVFETPLAANPVTVIRAIFRVGWSYTSTCVMGGAAFVIAAGLFQGVLQIQDEFGQAVAFWAFWVVLLYLSMVVLRCLGLFCYRQAIVLDWFPDRTRSTRPD